jgi:hypothetical protein
MQLPQVQPGGHMWRFDGRRRGRGRSLLHFFRGRFAIGTEMRPDFVGLVVIERTGVGLLFRKTYLRQVLDNQVTLHFQFARQFVDSNLPHA